MPATKKPTRQIASGAAFAKLIIDARHELGWSQDFLAAKSGLNRSTILRWESGDASRPEPDALKAVCRLLGVNQFHALYTLGYLDAGQYQSAIAATAVAA